jgi:hypothetical protein
MDFFKCENNMVLPSCYWPPIEFFYVAITQGRISIEVNESFIKQTFRNRTQIYGPNGKHDLVIPINKKSKEFKDFAKVEAKEGEDWKKNHWQSIQTAYGNAPFFEHFEMYIRSLYESSHNNLKDINELTLNLSLKLLQSKIEVHNTTNFVKSEKGQIDLREELSPKRPSLCNWLETSYYQPHSFKHGFISNLSILDLLFNTGPESIQIIKKLKYI